MKPLKLTLSGWGPYREQQSVDFTAMKDGGLFLITGPTGAGKTTIFDGIAFALYGEVSGTVREKNSLRSDFADPSTPTYAELEFVHRGKKYRILRNPRYERPKLRGEGMTAEGEDGLFWQGDELLATGSLPVTAAVEELLGLNCQQFKQISMIAQGEFQQLLVASSKERTQIFRNIFQTRLYEAMTGIFGAMVKELTVQIDERKHRADELAGTIRVEGEAFQELLGKKNRNYGKIIREAEKEQERLKEETAHIDRILAGLEKDYKAKVQLVERARQHNRQVKDYEAGMEQVRQLREEKTALSEQLKLLKKEYQKLPGRKALLEERRESVRRMEEQRAALQGVKEQADQLGKAQEEYLQLDAAAVVKKAAYEQQDDRYRKAAAGIIARDLEEGLPCPVCGSLHHPSPAVAEEDLPDEAELKRLKAAYETAWRAASEAQARAAALSGGLKEKRKALGEMAFEDDGTAALRELQTRIAGEKAAIAGEEAELLQCEKRFRDSELKLEKLKTAISERRAGLKAPASRELKDVGGLAAQLEETEKKKREASKEREGRKFAYTANKRALEALKDHIGEKEKLEQRYGIVRDVERAAAGYNNRNLGLEQYVLSVYFDEILRAANLRLLQMTDDRYELSRLPQTKDRRSREGMELEVLDQYTGKKRSVKSLSGGETFKAALALALGTSDVIQGYAGGIQVETLFVDEGFGALDEESLSQAVTILTALSGGNRMIGIISHVEELKERIDRQILVEKTNTGSRILMDYLL